MSNAPPATPYRVDLADPVAPSVDFSSEGDAHSRVTLESVEMIRMHFADRGPSGRQHYIGKSVMVYYPESRGFAPDLFVVFDVDDHERDSWIVTDEGKGPDIAIEVHWQGDNAKDYKRNLSLYALHGITEYFIFDIGRRSISGFRLAPGATAYHPIIPHGARYDSQVLGLNIGVEGNRFRFYVGHAALPTEAELCAALGRAIDDALAQAADAAEQLDVACEKAAAAEARIRELEARLAERNS